MRSSRAVLLAASLVLPLLAGCFGSGDGPGGDAGGLVPVEERYLVTDYVTEGDWSQVLEKGPYPILDGVGRFIDVAVPAGNGLPVQKVHMGLFFPDIEGCDWSASSLPDKCKVPVLADVGPYYGEPVLGDVHATEPANRLGRFLIENLVPHGYAVAQVAIAQPLEQMLLPGRADRDRADAVGGGETVANRGACQLP